MAKFILTALFFALLLACGCVEQQHFDDSPLYGLLQENDLQAKYKNCVTDCRLDLFESSFADYHSCFEMTQLDPAFYAKSNCGLYGKLDATNPNYALYEECFESCQQYS